MAPKKDNTRSVLITGLGGQGIILAGNIISSALFSKGFDVKKSEVHGMSQRGGSVESHIRFGRTVYSPLIPYGCADYLIALDENEKKRLHRQLLPGGSIIFLPSENRTALPSPRTLNVYLSAVFLRRLGFSKNDISGYMSRIVKKKYIDINNKAIEAAFRNSASF
ncbi:MAG: hypothetical protein A2096_07140 [Spirochaetes bacterium GWF1_41_5]|nr:MAG: hypothetical protein A2096_07140 [Spirochaetes bacterium GWF1_41_5]HBE04619.1 pyruvate ferredoxin oxidoreductase [Spirochaetia bacterium]